MTYICYEVAIRVKLTFDPELRRALSEVFSSLVRTMHVHLMKKHLERSPMTVSTLTIVYLVAVNLIGFAIMGIDKYRARKRAYRIPEATLFTVAIIGGSIGSILGMYTFRHKTRHRSFTIGMPAILILQIILVILIMSASLNIVTI